MLYGIIFLQYYVLCHIVYECWGGINGCDDNDEFVCERLAEMMRSTKEV